MHPILSQPQGHISPNEIKRELLDLGVEVDGNRYQFDLTEGHYTQCPDNRFSGEFMLGGGLGGVLRQRR